jgi:hypothetical protein
MNKQQEAVIAILGGEGRPSVPRARDLKELIISHNFPPRFVSGIEEYITTATQAAVDQARFKETNDLAKDLWDYVKKQTADQTDLFDEMPQGGYLESEGFKNRDNEEDELIPEELSPVGPETMEARVIPYSEMVGQFVVITPLTGPRYLSKLEKAPKGKGKVFVFTATTGETVKLKTGEFSEMVLHEEGVDYNPPHSSNQTPNPEPEEEDASFPIECDTCDAKHPLADLLYCPQCDKEFCPDCADENGDCPRCGTAHREKEIQHDAPLPTVPVSCPHCGEPHPEARLKYCPHCLEYYCPSCENQGNGSCPRCDTLPEVQI